MPKTSNESFIEKLLLIDNDPTENPLDLIFNYVDDLMIERKFDEVDDLLKAIPISKLSIASLLAVLTVTLSAKKSLPYRSKFFECVKQELISREDQPLDKRNRNCYANTRNLIFVPSMLRGLD